VAPGVGGQLIECPRGVAPERMPKADATGLAPKKSAAYNPPAHDWFVRGRVWLLLLAALNLQALHTLSLSQVKIKSISLVKSRSGGLGPKTRRPPGPLCRAF
jgi:hypothetical protein